MHTFTTNELRIMARNLSQTLTMNNSYSRALNEAADTIIELRAQNDELKLEILAIRENDGRI